MIRLSGVIVPVALVCIWIAVSSRRMRVPSKAPFCRCAIMKRPMSSPVAARLPAGARLMNSYGFGLPSDACL